MTESHNEKERISGAWEDEVISKGNSRPSNFNIPSRRGGTTLRTGGEVQ